MQRREFLSTFAAAGVAAAVQDQPKIQRKGRIKQGLMRTNFGANSPLSFDDQCKVAARLGCYGFDLINPPDWPTLKKYGLIPTMGPTGGVTIQDGLIRRELHEQIEKSMRASIDQCAVNGVPNMITVGGQRRGMSYAEGADNCVAYFNRIKGYAEDNGVTICMEVMNSKYDTNNTLGRPDQICDHLAWGVEVCKRVNSPRVKMLFDIYHVQIMDGNLIQNIKENFQWIAHFHTGGVPGRNELDDTQEINYRLVAKAIADLGFTGYVSHEFRPGPGKDPIKSIEQAIEIMDV
ncbi:MAG TPA: sugar phosphate isomerase/epimerase family protein [Terriglobia bacterium]|nr:sugar phosphate isomerase/epimerase family protein [Terriglobia bacterium]